MPDSSLEQFLIISRCRVREHYLPKLLACLGALDQEQLWRVEGPGNSIGAITGHLLEHLQRHVHWLDTGQRYGGANRLEECFSNTQEKPRVVSARARETFRRWDREMGRLFDTVQATGYLPEGLPGMPAIYHLVEHLGYHVGQIVAATTRVTGQEFQFCQHGLNEAALLGQIARMREQSTSRQEIP